MSGRAQVIVLIHDGIIQGAAVMESIEYPSSRAGNVLALGGLPGFLQRYMETFIDYLIEWSRVRGCNNLIFSGRRGWERYLENRFEFEFTPPTISGRLSIEPERVLQ